MNVSRRNSLTSKFRLSPHALLKLYFRSAPNFPHVLVNELLEASSTLSVNHKFIMRSLFLLPLNLIIVPYPFQPAPISLFSSMLFFLRHPLCSVDGKNIMLLACVCLCSRSVRMLLSLDYRRETSLTRLIPRLPTVSSWCTMSNEPGIESFSMTHDKLMFK